MTAIHFLGAAGTVTGSRHLVEHGRTRILLDCGLFQGEKQIRSRNWDPFPVPAGTIDAVVLSHAHIDHTGWLPRLVREGFRGTVYASRATRDLAAIMLPDSGRLHEEEAEYANRKRFSKHSPALPLYTEDDAVRALRHLRSVDYDEPRQVAPGVRLSLTRAGHILGSSTVRLDLEGEGHPRSIVFSGDLGRYDTPIIPDPEGFHGATHLIVECTYGDRSHDAENPREKLARVVLDTIERRGVLVVPAFAIGRTQDLLYHLRQLQLSGRIPSLPIFVDSPMACDATPLYLTHREEHDDEMVRLVKDGHRPLQPSFVEFARSAAESRAINDHAGPMIVISASGMATGGRVLHHLAQRLPDERNTVLFTGYQAQGSRGRKLLQRAESVRIHGRDVPVRARIEKIGGFSAHGDQHDLERWLSSCRTPPETTFCVHGEPGALEAMRARLQSRGWNAHVPAYLERVEI